MGLVDRGADIAWLSQFPHEKEILYPPLTGLEVRGSTVEGRIQIYNVVLSVNLSSLSLEQVVSKRRKMLLDMEPNLELELRKDLHEGGIATHNDGIEMLVKQLGRSNMKGPLNHPADFYNDDDNLSSALNDMLTAKAVRAGAGEHAAEHVRLVKRLAGDALQRFGFNPAAYSATVEEALDMLVDENENARREGLERLASGNVTALAQHAGAVIKMFNDPEWNVRVAAVTAFGKLEGAGGRWVGELVSMLETGEARSQEIVLAALSKLDAAVLSKHVAVVHSLLANSNAGVRCAAVRTLGKLDGVLVANAISGLLSDPDADVRFAVLEALGRQEAAVIQQHTDAIRQRLLDFDKGVRVRSSALLKV